MVKLFSISPFKRCWFISNSSWISYNFIVVVSDFKLYGIRKCSIFSGPMVVSTS